MTKGRFIQRTDFRTLSAPNGYAGSIIDGIQRIATDGALFGKLTRILDDVLGCNHGQGCNFRCRCWFNVNHFHGSSNDFGGRWSHFGQFCRFSGFWCFNHGFRFDFRRLSRGNDNGFGRSDNCRCGDFGSRGGNCGHGNWLSRIGIQFPQF